MTSSHQEEAAYGDGGAQGVRNRLRATWTRGQLVTAAGGVVLSSALWVLSAQAHDTGSTYISNLTWTLAATVTLATMGWLCFSSAHNAGRRRARRQDELARQTFDRQEELAGEILRQLGDAARAMEARHREFAEAVLHRQGEMSATLVDRQQEIGKSLSAELEAMVGAAVAQMADAAESHRGELELIRKRVKQVVVAMENRNRDAQNRYDAFGVKSERLNDMMGALVTFLQEVLPDAQVKTFAPRRPNGG